MNWINSDVNYGKISIALHWLMLALIVAVYACIEFRELYERGSDPREALKAWHFTLGLTVFLLAWLRVLMYVVQRHPAIKPSAPVWQDKLSRAVHIMLLVFMIGMPLGGWLILSAEGDPVPFWSVDLPALVGPNETLAHVVEDVHETVGTIGYFLIGLHAAAALFHHYIRKDNTLIRMLPAKDG